jgi:hypothetical protein
MFQKLSIGNRERWSVVMIRARFEFKPQDLWIGAFWRAEFVHELQDDFCVSVVVSRRRLDVWICLLPMLPLHVTWLGGVAALRSATSAEMTEGVVQC